MIGKKVEFDSWCQSVKDRYTRCFSETPKFPDLVCLSSQVQERMLRCAIEARFFDIDCNDRDDLAILAHHTLLLDAIKYHSKKNDRNGLYGSGPN
jgi:hypothetical protein